ncbi:unnamed protein product [Cuscuta epithymum]|uniref:Tubby C-terminal domain-containing protein n=1 Tax=Cuscuta epithymum TaxID=186058 RepID=A0AAV0ETG8_9ASTE|nr:unnamed protein product [Cuscuta epithymum]CAH9126566.1 unnamed protein product [Cuscuta epithymum]CAH9140724.1 unnamed protein product [Cuscuta epithymum]
MVRDPLNQPGPKDGTIQCFIQRDKRKSTYYLFLCPSPDLLVEKGKLLLSAKRTQIIPFTEYVISSNAEKLSQSSKTCIGKLRSNFVGTKYAIYDTQLAWTRANILTPEHPSQRLYSKKVSPKVQTKESYKLGHITYNLNDLGSRVPRKMHCTIHSTPESKPLVLENKEPRWHEKLQVWCLDFKGRVTVKSVKNFQLFVERGGHLDHDEVILQFGKVGEDVFTMDYRYPLSAFEAFAICLSSFDTKVACP